MKKENPVKHLAVAFAIALVLYVVSFVWIENRRTRNGPWKVVFTNETGIPTLIIDEPMLNVSAVRINFPGQPTSTTNAAIAFATAREVPFDLPFGKCVFMDPTFQPGTLVFALFGHEIQLIPRVLTIDKREYAWNSGMTMSVTNTPPKIGVRN
jgi:hypothetical protein